MSTRRDGGWSTLFLWGFASINLLLGYDFDALSFSSSGNGMGMSLVLRFHSKDFRHFLFTT